VIALIAAGAFVGLCVVLYLYAVYTARQVRPLS
jgi:hypothetical protein